VSKVDCGYCPSPLSQSSDGQGPRAEPPKMSLAPVENMAMAHGVGKEVCLSQRALEAALGLLL